MRLLVITHTFPPSPHSNAKRPWYLARGFLEAGWQVDICTSFLAMPSEATESLAHRDLRIFRFRDPVDALCKRFARAPRLSKVLILACSGVLWPDGYVLWARKAFRAVQRHAPYDAVLGFVLPASVLLAARNERFPGATLVFDYQESVTPIYRTQGRRSPLQRALLPRLEQLERQSLHNASRVVFTADSNRREYIRLGLVPERATAHVPYFYDEAVFGLHGTAPRPGFEIVYFGSFDWKGHRTPDAFLKALALFLSRHPEARPETRFLFHGTWLSEHNTLLREQGVEDVVSIEPGIGYEQYLQKLKTSPILLLVISSAHNLFMPSKIVDYFGARRPIMAFVPRDSEMRRVLEQAGLAEFSCDEGDVAAGAAILERLWLAYNSGTLEASSEKTRFWSSATQVPPYVQAVTDLARRLR